MAHLTEPIIEVLSQPGPSRGGIRIGELNIHACNTGVIANGAHLEIGTLRATATPVVFDFTNGGSVDLGKAVHDVSAGESEPAVEGKRRKLRKSRHSARAREQM